MVGKIGPGSVKQDITLADYIKRKQDPKKLSFDEWFLQYLGKPFEDWEFNLTENDMKNAWKAAQENK